ncbi:hypothetical protein HDG38_003026 [Paraburkholderia sp. WSM4177]|nr:hypothetical protein [Paraburkholderia sp. WSM4177]MBB5485222.1 hypothetical protein [Paraburkholderia sp. WSM4180]
MKPTRLYPAKSNAPSFASFPAHITAELHRYDVYLRDVRGLAAETRRTDFVLSACSCETDSSGALSTSERCAPTMFASFFRRS